MTEQIYLWRDPEPAPTTRFDERSCDAHNQLVLERLIAIASELHPDHWPVGVRELAERIAEGHAWTLEHGPGETRHEQTSGLALALVGRDPDDRHHGQAGSPMGPRARKAFEANVRFVVPLRAAIVEAMEMHS
jgi:hypothetical protein